MKKLILAAFALTTAASVFAQGTVLFENRNTLATTHVWGPSTSNPSLSLIGNASNDNPSGSQQYAASGMFMIGGYNGGTASAPTSGGSYGYKTTLTQLLDAPGAGADPGSLLPDGATTTFKTGASFGNIALITDTLSRIAPDAPAATLEIVAWDASTGITTWTAASAAWLAGTIAAGESGAFNVFLIGGSVNTAPIFASPTFNLYFIPEPSTFALCGLGAAALMIFRRRK